MKIETTTILENALLFSMTRMSWGNVRKADKSRIHTEGDAAQDEKTKSRLKLSKRLISDCDELDAIYDELNNLYGWCMGRSMFSCLREGVYFVKKDMVTVFEERIAATQKKLEGELIPAFLAAYNDAIAKSEVDLNGQFDASDYPPMDEMRAKFGVKHSWLEFNVPKDLPADVKVRETRKMQEQMQNAAVEVVYSLRESVSSLVEDLARRLEVQPGTAGKRFTAPGAIENMRDFLERFKALNIANDVELEKVIGQAKAIVENQRDVSNLANSQLSRDRIKAAVAGVQAQCATLIADRPKRKITFED